MNDSVWLVGGSNQIAAWLVPALLQAGYGVAVDSRGARPPWIARHARLHWRIAGDGQLPLPHEPYAALVYIGPMEQFGPWWTGAPKAARARRVIVFSSTSVLTKANSSSERERAMAAALAAGEQAVRGAAGTTPVSILRPTMIYGAGLDQNLTRLAGWLRRYRFMPMTGPGAGRRQPVHARDLAHAVIGMLAAGAHGDYQLAGGTTLTYADMVRRIAGSLGQRPRLVTIARPLSRLALSVLRRHPRWADLTPAMLARTEMDLVFDDAAARRDFGYDPQPFAPTAQTWLRLDQRPDWVAS